MSERPRSIEELKAGIPVAALDRTMPSWVDLSRDEVDKISWVFDKGVEQIRKVAPSIADDIAIQKQLAINMAAVAKATFPVRKNYTFPSVAGSLGVSWLFPAGLKYKATPSPSFPCYTSYITNRWDMAITADTPAYILGDGTNFYRASPTTDAYSFILIFNNGLIEVGTTPSIDQFRLYTEGKQDYGAYSVEPLVDIPVEKNVAIYQYPTPLGAVFVSHERGVMWKILPLRSGIMTLKLLGMVFYEHGFLSDVKTAT